ncbi:hypothetical protein GCM10007391_07880 [Alteromonas halophila]|uniref:Uncharacterized protein n=2 Tax=Alteromonas halophila TaxID=516698 RepID=A0A918JFL4_9ALTE|nr:hypothetical protein GCM10007391_07880 [Alteromonas halophila]
MLASPVWAFALVVGLIENTRMFAEPLIATFAELLYLSLSVTDLGGASAVTFYTPMGIVMLAVTALPRIMLHYGFAWLFIFCWQTRRPLWLLLVAGLHGSFNMALLYLNSLAETPTTQVALIAAAFVAACCLLYPTLRYIRKPHLGRRQIGLSR